MTPAATAYLPRLPNRKFAPGICVRADLTGGVARVTGALLHVYQAKVEKIGPNPNPDTHIGASTAGIAEVIRSRRTIHLFKPYVPPRDVILQAIELARWAPNHKLTEPWRFYLLGRETANAVARLNARLVTEEKGERAGQIKLERWLAVPGWLVVTCRRSEKPVRQQEDYAACATAVQNIMLYLWNEGVGTKWTTGEVSRHPEFFKLLGIDPEEESVVSMLWYGFPAEIPETQRKPVQAIVRELP